MKLRIRGDSIRLRLRRPEVRALVEDGFVAESTGFAPGVEFGYRLEIGASPVHASFVGNQIRVVVPQKLAQTWASTDQVGIDAEQQVAGGRTLCILIEKDFACKEGNSAESQEGAFENPAGPVRC